MSNDPSGSAEFATSGSSCSLGICPDSVSANSMRGAIPSSRHGQLIDAVTGIFDHLVERRQIGRTRHQFSPNNERRSTCQA